MSTDKQMVGRAKGGAARAANMSPERRKEIAQLAASARWSPEARKATPKKSLADAVAVQRDMAKLAALDARIAKALEGLVSLQQERDELFATVQKHLGRRKPRPRPKKGP